MRKNHQLFDKKSLVVSLISLIFTFLVFGLRPYLTSHCEFCKHITAGYYFEQLFIILPVLPISFFIYSFLPTRRILDYKKFISFFSTRLYIGIITIFYFIVTNIISFFFYNHIPQGDAVVAYIQAKIFANGHLWVTPPRYPEFFLNSMVIHNGKYFSMVQHGHSLLLAGFTALHIPYLLSPILGTATIIIFFFLLRNCFDEDTAKTGILFLVLSPTFLFISSSYLNQNSSIFFIMLSLLFLSLALKHNKNLYSFLSGVFLGLAFFSRTTMIAFLPGFAFVFFLTGSKKKNVLAFFIMGFVPAFAIQFIDNFIYTGNVFRFGYSLHPDSNLHSIGFGLGKGEPTFGINGHTPLKALINFFYDVFAFSLHLYGWPLFSLSFIPVAFVKWKKNIWDIFSIAVIISAVIFFSFYWFHGVSPMGPKYYFEIIPLLVVLTIRGLKKFNARSLVTILFIFDILIYIPSGLKIFRGAWGTNNHCYNEAKKQELHNAIVFIHDLKGTNEYERTINRHNYLSVAFRNAPFIKRGDIIYAKDLEKKNFLLINQFRERKVFIFKYLNGGKEWSLTPYKYDGSTL